MEASVTACVRIIENQFKGSKNTEALFDCVHEIFPVDTDSYNIISVEGNSKKFKATIECKFGNIASGRIICFQVY